MGGHGEGGVGWEIEYENGYGAWQYRGSSLIVRAGKPQTLGQL